MLERVAPASSARRAAWKARMRNVLLSASGSCSVGMVNLRIKGAFDFFCLGARFLLFLLSYMRSGFSHGVASLAIDDFTDSATAMRPPGTLSTTD